MSQRIIRDHRARREAALAVATFAELVIAWKTGQDPRAERCVRALEGLGIRVSLSGKGEQGGCVGRRQE